MLMTVAKVITNRVKSEGGINKGRKDIFYLTMHSTNFIYSYMVSDIW